MVAIWTMPHLGLVCASGANQSCRSGCKVIKVSLGGHSSWDWLSFMLDFPALIFEVIFQLWPHLFSTCSVYFCFRSNFRTASAFACPCWIIGCGVTMLPVMLSPALDFTCLQTLAMSCLFRRKLRCWIYRARSLRERLVPFISLCELVFAWFIKEFCSLRVCFIWYLSLNHVKYA